jgi:hypothetical protein
MNVAFLSARWSQKPVHPLDIVSIKMRIFTLIVAGLVGAFLSPSASAQDWARKLFETHQHDFGVVARGGKAEFAFKLTNNYKETIHIAEARSSCGCTTPVVVHDRLKSRETGEILAKFNTRSFLGHKEATITVVIDEPVYAEVQLRVSGFIRSDVVFTPGSVNFSDAKVGEESIVPIEISYAGRDTWAITDVRSKNGHLGVELVETHRGSGRVDYRMMVKLRPTAPAGTLRDEISIITNDATQQSIPLLVEARVQGELVVSPPLLSLGAVQPGESVTKKVLIRGAEPFTVTGATSANPGLNVQLPSESKKLQLVPVTFKAQTSGDKLNDTVQLETSLGTVEIKITGSVK